MNVLALGALLVTTGSGLAVQAQPMRTTPGGCPPGFKQAMHPLNPQLGCLPTNLQANPDQPSQGQKRPVVFQPAQLPGPMPGCPTGFKQAVHPLNPQLGCLPTNMLLKP